MNDIERNLREYLKSNDFEKINDYLIRISSNPSSEDIRDIDLLIENDNENLWNKIAINLVYHLGEFAKNHSVDQKYLNYLRRKYFESDRWIRVEILNAFLKMMGTEIKFDDLATIMQNSITEDYNPIRITALNILKQFDSLPMNILTKVYFLLSSDDKQVISLSSHILKNNLNSYDLIIELLQKVEQIKSKLTIVSIRNFLVNFFKELDKLETFKNSILKTNLLNNTKNNIINEIDIMKKIINRRNY